MYQYFRTVFSIFILVARRKTIYEYHRVNFEGQDILNNTIISLTAQPTCLALTNCQECVEALAPTFKVKMCSFQDSNLQN